MNSIEISSYPEKLIQWLPLPRWLALLLFWEGIFLADYLLTINEPAAQEHIWEYGFLVLFFALVCISIIYCSHILKNLFSDILLFIETPRQEIREWYERKLKLSYSGASPLIFAIAFTLLVNFTAGYAIRSFTPLDSSTYYLRFGYELAGFFVLGVGIWALINVMLIPIGLTNFRIKVSVNQISGRGLQALGTAFFKMSLAIAFSFIPLVIAGMISPLIEDLSILTWLGAGTATIFGFFIIPQFGIHSIMVGEKQQRLLSFSTHLEDALERSLKDPSSENMQRLKEMFELQAHLKGMNEWPFDVNTLWQLITALLIPVVLALLEILY